MKKYTEEEIKEHLRAEEHYLRTGSKEGIEYKTNFGGQWLPYGSGMLTCLSRFKPDPKIVPFDVTDAPLMVEIRAAGGGDPCRAVVIAKDTHFIAYVDAAELGFPCVVKKLGYNSASKLIEFTRDGEAWQPYGRKEG